MLILKRSITKLQKQKSKAAGNKKIGMEVSYIMNPASMMKLMSAKNKFQANHPKFFAFLTAVFSRGIDEGTIIEVTITRPGEAPITSNMKIQQSDMELLGEIKEIAK